MLGIIKEAHILRVVVEVLWGERGTSSLGNKQRRRKRVLETRSFEIGFEGWLDWLWHKEARGRGFPEQGTMSVVITTNNCNSSVSIMQELTDPCE